MGLILLVDCTSVTCTEPLTYAPSGSPCGCVWPIQVNLRFSVAIYTFFTLVTELAEEIAASVALNHSQVRIMGANAASPQLEKSTVLINLVPLGLKFNDTTALSIYKKFWSRQVLIKASLFGAYEVLYVRYPGHIFNLLGIVLIISRKIYFSQTQTNSCSFYKLIKENTPCLFFQATG